MALAKVRCAIYTRKSSEGGLEQDFNSLDAQYEACAAYIASQRQEGWSFSRKRYDDGGISGGTLDRPGLQSLFADIDAGLIDMIVVYKIDRLTRSLSDFAKIIDLLDAARASFVSVTQSFNTATSMGRLTLNMLLSFAQFEREVTAERIRDKITASKAKGMWMGGTVPLGYEPHPDKTVRSLVVNSAEVEEVRTIFKLAAEIGNLRLVAEQVEHLGIRSKRRNYASGKRLGGSVMSRGQIHHILTNPLYIGRIRHKTKTYPGCHEAIVDQDLWDRVHAQLDARTAKVRGAPTCYASGAMFKGKLFDETGDRLTPSHTIKKCRKFRYYFSNRLIRGKDPSGWRLPAASTEEAILNAVRSHLTDPNTKAEMVRALSVQEIADLHERLDDLPTRNDRSALVSRASLLYGAIEIVLDAQQVAALIGIRPQALATNCLTFTAPFTRRWRGVEQKILIGETKPEPNPALLRCLAEAHHWVALLKTGKSLAQVAHHTGRSQDYIRRRILLASLSPQIQKAITTGNHPDHWSILSLIRMDLPLDWRAQDQLLLY